MKKLYIMFSNGIVGMGGGQMYTRNKIVYAQQCGFDVAIYSGQPGKIVIEELQKFEKNIKKELLLCPLVYHQKTVKRVIGEIAAECVGYDEIIIESGIAHMALWGELLADQLKCKHMVHLLDERNDLLVPEEYLDFYWFKHNRCELSGITKESLKMLFRNDSKITDDNSFFLTSLCQNVIDNECNFNFSLPDADYNLGTIGRLEKQYVIEAARAFAQIAIEHSDKIFNVLFIGGSQDVQYEYAIKNLFNNISNVNLFMLGYIYPIPGDLVKKIDLFVSSAGSAGVSYRLGKVTISVDSVDLKAIGILGYTTQRALRRVDEPKQEIKDLVNQILFGELLKTLEFTPKNDAEQLGLNVLDEHFEFLKKSDQNKEYFDVMMLKLGGKDAVKCLISHVLGDKLFLFLICKKRGII